METKCKIEQRLPATILALIKENPANEVIRTMVLAQLKQPIPDTAKTFTAIKKWIETTFDPTPSPIPVQTPQDPVTVFRVSVTRSETQRGTADYMVRASGGMGMRFSPDDIRELAEESDDASEFREGLAERIDEFARENISCDSDGDYQFDNYSCEETTDEDIDYNLDSAYLSAVEWLRAHLPIEWARITGTDFEPDEQEDEE